MYFSVGLHGQATSSSPSLSGAPMLCMHGTNSPSAPSTSAAARPIRVMIFMLTTAYGESVICTPSWAIGEPSGPMLNGTTYIVRPAIDPANRPRRIGIISLGSIQLLVGPGILLAARADEGPLLHAGDVARIAARKVAARPLLRIEPDEGACLDELLAEGVVLGIRAVAPMHVRRGAQLDHLFHPGDKPAMLDPVRCVHDPSMPRRPRLAPDDDILYLIAIGHQSRSCSVSRARAQLLR